MVMNASKIEKLAREYSEQVHSLETAAVTGEPEAQLTTPVSNLFTQLADMAELGQLRLIRESRLDRSRPDFAVLHVTGGKAHQKGYVELKAPDVIIDAAQWTGRNARQWATMKVEAEVLIVSNGRQARLYKDGEPLGDDATLPYDPKAEWDPASLIGLLRRFLDEKIRPVTSVNDLSKRLAIRTADLRDRLLWLMDQDNTASAAAKGGYKAWKQHVHPQASERDFADGVSQVVAYGMVLAALSIPDADRDSDGYISVEEARVAIRSISPVMAAAFAPLVDKAELSQAVQVELGALETLISAINPSRVNKSADRRGEPWLYFYEDFLGAYDPDERRQAGVYYTPLSVVKAMVRIVDHILVKQFGITLGFADTKVVTLDPATGTGTFPLAVIDQARKRAVERRGPAGSGQSAATLANNLYAFELLPGPYAVAHLRLSQRLRELSTSVTAAARVVLTDTLESPLDPQYQLSLFGDAEVLAAEQNRAKKIKLEQKVTVVIGNPPYRRVPRKLEGRGSGGWILDGSVPGRKNSKSLFDDILDVARQNTIFSHQASLYNLYVYFWRWAIWKAFEAHGDGPGVVAFITANSWLHGPGFMGLRQLVRELCDDVWVLDLGGDNTSSQPDENIFAIETPVAIVVLVRKEKTAKKVAGCVHYRRIEGTAAEKLLAMDTIAAADDPLAGPWAVAAEQWRETFVPPTGKASWQDMPALTDIFPWQQPGCMHSRLWPIAPDEDTLVARWKRFVASPHDERAALYVTPTSGRNIHTKVGGLTELSKLTAGTPHQPVVRYGFRSFDRQWTFEDPRLAKTESPALWATVSPKQVYLVSLTHATMSEGPSITVTECVPDKHYFKGSAGGKNAIPLYRDKLGTIPNITSGFPKFLGGRLGTAPPSPEDIAAYVYAVLSSPIYLSLFAEEMKTPGPRVPVTRDQALWQEAVQLGSELLWLHTYATRFRDGTRGHEVPSVEGLGWQTQVTKIPVSASDISYNADTGILTISDGQITGVRRDVWAYKVSGMQVVKKWLGYRTQKGAGRAASSHNPLDQIRPTSWKDAWNDELLDLLRVLTLTLDKQVQQRALLEKICAGPTLSASELPKPKAQERQPPKV